MFSRFFFSGVLVALSLSVLYFVFKKQMICFSWCFVWTGSYMYSRTLKYT